MRRQLNQRHREAHHHEGRLLRARRALDLPAGLGDLFARLGDGAEHGAELLIDVQEAPAHLDAELSDGGAIVDGLARDLVGGAVGLPGHLLGRRAEGHLRHPLEKEPS